MKSCLGIFAIIFIMFSSCGTDPFQIGQFAAKNIVKAEIINENTIHIYFSGQPQEIDFTYDIKILVNGTQYYINQSQHNILQDRIDGLVRYRCRLDRNLIEGAKVEISGKGHYVKGNVIIYYAKE